MRKHTVQSALDMLDRRSQHITECGCQIWLGHEQHGYGYTRFQGKTILVHRLAWILIKGPIPNGLFVCHTCDIGVCFSIHHLFLGTNSDNMRDRYGKGRNNLPAGEKNSQSKLKTNQVIEIRADHRSDTEVAKDYDVCRSTIHRIRDRTIWKWL